MADYKTLEKLYWVLVNTRPPRLPSYFIIPHIINGLLAYYVYIKNN